MLTLHGSNFVWEGRYCSVCEKLYDPAYQFSSFISCCFTSAFISSVQISLHNFLELYSPLSKIEKRFRQPP